MAHVYKEITKGASYYGQTTAVAQVEFARKHGVMPCGSGDDHVMTAEDRKLLEEHTGDGDLHLPAGPLNTRRPKVAK